MILGPRQQLNNRGRRCVHKPSDPGDALLVEGDFNTNLTALEGRGRDKGISAAMKEEGLEEMRGHFLTRNKP